MRTRALRQHLINSGHIEQDGPIYRLIIPPMQADTYTDAQLDDYEHALPRRFTNRPPQRLRIRARFSQQDMKGTAGFGFWNHPFSRDGAVLAPPCNVWFFHSSPESDLQLAHGVPGHGFKAAMLNSGQLNGRVMAVAGRIFDLLLKTPILAAPAIAVARTAVNARECLINVDMTTWHEYDIDWQPSLVTFRRDGSELLRAPHPPIAPLGFVAWVDNYRATAVGGSYQFAYVAAPTEQWLEIEIMGADE